MKILHLNRSDVGGAGRATYRIHNALRSVAIDSTMWVIHTAMSDWTVANPLSPSDRLISRFALYIQFMYKILTNRESHNSLACYLPLSLVKVY